MSGVGQLILALLFGLLSLLIVLVSATLSPQSFTYAWLKREVIALMRPFHRNWIMSLLLRFTRALWLYLRLKAMTRPGRLDLAMFTVAIGAVTGVWDQVALRALEIFERWLVRQGWI